MNACGVDRTMRGNMPLTGEYRPVGGFSAAGNMNYSNNKKDAEMTMKNRFATEYSKEKWQHDLTIYKEFQELINTPGACVGEVSRYLMKKYNIHSESTIWLIRRRVAERLAMMEG